MTNQQTYNDTIARHGCIVCRTVFGAYTPATLHHVRRNGQPRDTAQVIPLCHQHHQGGYCVGIHSGRETWEKAFGSETEMADQIIELYGRMP